MLRFPMKTANFVSLESKCLRFIKIREKKSELVTEGAFKTWKSDGRRAANIIIHRKQCTVNL